MSVSIRFFDFLNTIVERRFAYLFGKYDHEKAFLKFLKEFNAGLKLFEGSHADFSQWLNLKLDRAGNPVVNPNPC